MSDAQGLLSPKREVALPGGAKVTVVRCLLSQWQDAIGAFSTLVRGLQDLQEGVLTEEEVVAGVPDLLIDWWTIEGSEEVVLRRDAVKKLAEPLVEPVVLAEDGEETPVLSEEDRAKLVAEQNEQRAAYREAIVKDTEETVQVSRDSVLRFVGIFTPGIDAAGLDAWTDQEDWATWWAAVWQANQRPLLRGYRKLRASGELAARSLTSRGYSYDSIESESIPGEDAPGRE